MKKHPRKTVLPPFEGTVLLPFEGTESSRRGFLQLVGFGIAGAAISGCSRGPTRHVVPALVPAEGVVPGRPYWIATTCGGCEAGCGVLAKCRDGRPIKLEGNPQHPVSSGGLCPAGQASVLTLYDSRRFEKPLRAGAAVEWEELDPALSAALGALRSGTGRVRLLTGTTNGPSTRTAIGHFLSSFGDARHVTYDGLSCAALLDAHEAAFGRRALPRMRFELARTIVSFDADFLSTWISPVEFTRGYSRGRMLEGDTPRMSMHYQLEGRMSLTGSCADERVRVAPHEEASLLAGLCDLLEVRAGATRRLAGAIESCPRRDVVERIAESLSDSGADSLVVAGSNDVEVQLYACYANHLLGAYGRTLDLDEPSQQRLGDDRALAALRDELAAGAVDVLIVAGANPAYDLPDLDLAAAGQLIVCAEAPDETTAIADWVAPLPHALESWGDAEPRAGVLSLTQPTVPPLRAGRTLRASLARWSEDGRSERELLREHWREAVWPSAQDPGTDFDAFFDAALERGFAQTRVQSGQAWTLSADAVRPTQPSAPAADALTVVLYPKAGVLDGRHAHNPWLQELPDPVTKITWDNYACISPVTAERLDLSEGDIARLEVEGDLAPLELPVHVQRGQDDRVVAVALGYGRLGTDRFADVGPDWIGARPTVAAGGVVGVNAATLVATTAAGLRGFQARSARLTGTGRSSELASTQEHHSLEVPAHLAPPGHEVRDKDIAPRATFEQWQADPATALHGRHHVSGEDLWKEDHAGRVRWGMTIDLARCTGCSACVVGCQAENNVAVVGKDEVRRHREMSWLRIDRYFQGEGDAVSTVHQPMMCQQCDHAPCEAVCPVLATVHSSEGLNQQVYNRCVGTRYCANTCPYKVRRFNWFDYEPIDPLQAAAFNPDVTVRSRGVMEKCSFCVQRIQEAKAEAKRDGRAVRDGEIQPACQQSCPADAITFGDLNDPESRVAVRATDARGYGVLEELNVRPSVRYLSRVDHGQEEDSHDH
ncbi:MAG: 4Fe-4S dicluster domain-containing protein [bacterium]|nr:4Fe-4S dicluster domain-containing protein [bacterium]